MSADVEALTEAEREALSNALWDDGCHGFGVGDHMALPAVVAKIKADAVAAALAPVQALADDLASWEGYDSRDTGRTLLYDSVHDWLADLRAALAVNPSEWLKAEKDAVLAKAQERLIADAPGLNAELRHDGSSDPVMAAYIEGWRDAHSLVGALREEVHGDG